MDPRKMTHEELSKRLNELNDIKNSGAPMDVEGRMKLDSEIHDVFRQIELRRMAEGMGPKPMTADSVANFETFPAVPDESKDATSDAKLADVPRQDYPAVAIPDANPSNVDEDEVFGGGPEPKPASSGGLPPALIGVPIAVVLLIGALVALTRGGTTAQVADASAVLQTTSRAAASAAPAGGGQTYELGPLRVRRDPNSTVSTYTIDVFLRPPGTFTWTLDASCGTLAPLTTSAQVAWSFDNNTKTCPPGPQGPFPGKVTLTFTAQDGKTYTWTAGSDTGTFGEKVTIR